jgi:hypothetical protein
MLGVTLYITQKEGFNGGDWLVGAGINNTGTGKPVPYRVCGRAELAGFV